MKTLTFCLALIVMSCTLSFGQTYKVLWNFGSTIDDSATPLSNLIADGSGNLYGTSWVGGNAPVCGSCGTVFELSPNSDGTWTNTVIHAFCTNIVNNQCADGMFPKAGLIFDAVGNLYGTTENGGNVPCSFTTDGCGTVFMLSPPAIPGGSWTETVLYNFCSVASGKTCLDGAQPLSQLTFDSNGNLYGTTSGGGTGHISYGTVFELSPTQSGWVETVLYNFCTIGTGRGCKDGANPQAGVTFDKSGNLYGTTSQGGEARFDGGGVVYKLKHGSGGWSQTIVANDPPLGVGEFFGAVSFDPAGNLYSTGEQNGVFRLNTNHTKQIFTFNGTDGSAPAAGVILDVKNKVVYGTTSLGGAADGGTAFKINASGQETVLYTFCQQASCVDGAEPLAALFEDHAGNLYGTTKIGGANGQGVVFEITP